MNLDYILQRLMGRATCSLDSDARLYLKARIRNASKSSDRIRIGSHSIIQGELLVFAHGGEIDIGKWCYIGEGSRIWSAKYIRIGDRALISHNVNIMDNLTHPIAASARHEQFRAIATSGHPPQIELDEREVNIGMDALVGAGSFILRGVSIGEAAIVGAGSVVTRNIPSRTIVAGNPARRIRVLRPDEY